MEQSRVWVEAWSPSYGSSFEAPGGLEQSEEQVLPFVETTEWAPLTPRALGRPATAFVDGVSRVEARAFLASGSVSAIGMCASVGVGSVILAEGRNGAEAKANFKTTVLPARFGPSEVKRTAIFGNGLTGALPAISGDLMYASRSAAGPGPEHLMQELQAVRAELELEMARDLASSGYLVIADGPLLARREPQDIIGLIKSHQKSYLDSNLESVATNLLCGQRTPLFQFGAIRPRYSWYLRLADAANQHPWAAVARCEVGASVPLARAVELADISARHLPAFASREFWDSRAPQNLVPIATLERRLWHLLGDRDLIFRRIRQALERKARTG